MSGYLLTWKAPAGPPPTDGSALRPDTLGNLSPRQLAGVTLPVGRERIPLGELCQIEGAPGDRLTLRGAPPLDKLGALMRSGTLTIEGEAGNDLGASMQGGTIRVTGNAGHRVGGPHPTQSRGMRAGVILIEGDAGDYAALRMRRGLVSVAGRCGKSPGMRMIAGTLAIGRGPYDAPGLQMRRGSILLRSPEPITTSEHLTTDGTFRSESAPALRLMLAELRKLCVPIDDDRFEAAWTLSRGDRFELHKGEIWQCSI